MSPDKKQDHSQQSTTDTDKKISGGQEIALTTEKSTMPPPPPRHPSVQPEATETPGAQLGAKLPASEADGTRSGPSNASGFLKRALSSADRGKHGTAARFFSAYAQTWVGLSPIWLMGEALTPGKKVGTQFNKGRRKLVGAAEEVREVVATSSQDIVVIIDEKFKSSDGSASKMAERTAEVVKAAGENAILVVTSSLDKLSSQFLETSKDGKDGKNGRLNQSYFDLAKLAKDPQLKASLHRHGRDALVLLDGALAHPVVVTGVAQFAKSRGIPHADALLRLARLGLGRILSAIPEADAEVIQNAADERLEAYVEEIDAEELERVSSTADRAEAEMVGRAAEAAPVPKTEPAKAASEDQDPYEAMRKRTGCVTM